MVFESTIQVDINPSGKLDGFLFRCLVDRMKIIVLNNLTAGQTIALNLQPEVAHCYSFRSTANSVQCPLLHLQGCVEGKKLSCRKVHQGKCLPCSDNLMTCDLAGQKEHCELSPLFSITNPLLHPHRNPAVAPRVQSLSAPTAHALIKSSSGFFSISVAQWERFHSRWGSEMRLSWTRTPLSWFKSRGSLTASGQTRYRRRAAKLLWLCVSIIRRGVFRTGGNTQLPPFWFQRREPRDSVSALNQACEFVAFSILPRTRQLRAREQGRTEVLGKCRSWTCPRAPKEEGSNRKRQVWGHKAGSDVGYLSCTVPKPFPSSEVWFSVLCWSARSKLIFSVLPKSLLEL